jgi:hypothetical protein
MMTRHKILLIAIALVTAALVVVGIKLVRSPL